MREITCSEATFSCKSISCRYWACASNVIHGQCTTIRCDKILAAKMNFTGFFFISVLFVISKGKVVKTERSVSFHRIFRGCSLTTPGMWQSLIGKSLMHRFIYV